ncbi:unnamed protein product [Ectocarpus sp. 8 AP-2014]
MLPYSLRVSHGEHRLPRVNRRIKLQQSLVRPPLALENPLSPGVLLKFEWAPSLLRWLLGVVVVEGVLMACMGSVSSPPSAIQSVQQSECYLACKTSSKRETRHMSRKKAALRPFVRSSAGRSLGGGGRRAMLALISAVHVDLVEGQWLIEFPSGFRCMWNDLPHSLQFTMLLLMLGILYGVNRLFDKADEAMYTRLACATSGLLNERRNHHAPRILYPNKTRSPHERPNKSPAKGLSVVASPCPH